MYTKNTCVLAAIIVLLVFAAGCFKTSDKIQRTYFGESKTLKYGPVMAFAFKNGVWTEVKDPKYGSVAQFKGTIPSEIHDFALLSMSKKGDRATFDAACAYVGNLIKAGKITGDPDISFNIADYPFDQQGEMLNRDAFFSSPDAEKNIRQLNAFYLSRHWATGTECIIQWRFNDKGKPEVLKTSNKYWDDDPSISNSPETVVQMINDYTISMSN